MSEEKILKANEFEHAVDEAAPSTPANFQETYTDEANLVYRAASAEEILDDPAVLAAMIQHHRQYQCPRLRALDNYTKAKNEGIYKDDRRRVEEGKADHRAAHNFAKVINVFDVGYNTGVPIKKKSDDDNINAMIKEHDRLNDAPSLETELWRDFKKYGRAYELLYRNENDENRSVLSDVFESFICYDLSVERVPLFAVRYPRYKVGMEERTTVSVLTSKETIKYKPCGVDTLVLEEESRKEHQWGEVPMIEYSPDRDRMGGFEDVIPLIDLYDFAQSDTANYMSDFNDATMVISGDLDMDKYSAADVVAMKRANMLLLSNGVNPDGSKSQSAAEYLYKQYDAVGTEAYKSRVRTDIHSTSLVPDLSDESFAGTQSGEAMKYKLFGFQQVTKTAQNGFKAGLTRRYRLLLNIKGNVQEADNTDLGELKITFTPNLPKAVLDELKTLVDSGAEFSQETLLSLASFLEDVEAEIKKLEKEKESESDKRLTTLVFGNQNDPTDTEPQNEVE